MTPDTEPAHPCRPLCPLSRAGGRHHPLGHGPVSTVEGLRTVLPMAVGDRYRMDVRDDADGVVVRLKRRLYGV
jgi:hypothetical protein